MYIRFQSRSGSGLFAHAIEFNTQLKSRRALRRLRAEFGDLFTWLCDCTPEPPPDAYPDALSPRTWFKVAATEHIRRAWMISELLRQNGRWIRAIRSADPGEVLFEDQVQVVVVPNRTHYRPAAKPHGRANTWTGDRTTIRREGGRIP